MSLISRLRAVVAGEDYLDGDFDELDYETGEGFEGSDQVGSNGSNGLTPFSGSNPFTTRDSSSKVIGMPGISTATAEVSLMEPRSFDEMPKAIQALRERKTVILNLTMMEPDQAQRAVDFVAGGTFAIDGHQERVGESIFLFAPSCVTVTNSFQEEPSPSSVTTSDSDNDSNEDLSAPEPAWGEPVSTAI
ncbi:cell division protein SepF [Prochlorococcus marinus]|uniref:cell division protein SepF n=1 Tax=Prochlorococcus marinus TaxID=1219 RepID=UPI0022B3C710|nr:cell division protein SepF [Prochlorococcus marinus]